MHSESVRNAERAHVGVTIRLADISADIRMFSTRQPLVYQGFRVGGGGRNRSPSVADDRVILPYFIGDSSRLCHY